MIGIENLIDQIDNKNNIPERNKDIINSILRLPSWCLLESKISSGTESWYSETNENKNYIIPPSCTIPPKCTMPTLSAILLLIPYYIVEICDYNGLKMMINGSTSNISNLNNQDNKNILLTNLEQIELIYLILDFITYYPGLDGETMLSSFQLINTLTLQHGVALSLLLYQHPFKRKNGNKIDIFGNMSLEQLEFNNYSYDGISTLVSISRTSLCSGALGHLYEIINHILDEPIRIANDFEILLKRLFYSEVIIIQGKNIFRVLFYILIIYNKIIRKQKDYI